MNWEQREEPRTIRNKKLGSVRIPTLARPIERKRMKDQEKGDRCAVGTFLRRQKTRFSQGVLPNRVCVRV